MKKVLLLVVAIFTLCNFAANAQQRTKLYDGVYIVNYGGGTYGIEDDRTQQCISISIAQEYIDRENNRTFYKVVCGKWSQRVVKTGIKAAVEYVGKKTAGAGTKIAKVIGKAAEWIYEDFCESWESRL